jgi:hypothetical protein
MTTFKIKRHNLATPLRVTLKDNGAAIPLAGMNVFLLLSQGDVRRKLLFRRVCVVEDAAAGKIRYDWQAGDTDQVGAFAAEFEVVAQATGLKDTYPNDSYVPIQVIEDLGAD